MRRRASPLVVFALIAVLAAAVTLLLPGRKTAAPDVSFTLLDGRTATLQQWRGRPVLVAFWATSCAPCVEELPDLLQLYRELNPQGLEFVAVAMPYDPPLAVQNFARQFGVPYPIALDVSGEVVRAFRDIEVIPTALLIDPTGAIVFRAVGKLDTVRVRRLAAPFLRIPPTNSPAS